MLTTIHSRILAVLLLFELITISLSLVVFNYFEKTKNSISQITKGTEEVHVLLLEDIKVLHDFFENETINPAFFESGKSRLVEEHQKLCASIGSMLSKLNRAQSKDNIISGQAQDSLRKDFEEYNSLTNEIIRHILIRGFKDYGIEGKMRNYAHALEDFQDEIGLVNILQLRRHEKDFIIRQEDPYISKHAELIAVIKEHLSTKAGIPADKRMSITRLLDNYDKEFNNLVVYDKQLGLKSGAGLKKHIDQITNRIEAALSRAVELSQIQEDQALMKIKFLYLVFGILFITAGVISARYVSKRISRSITNLKHEIDDFVKSDFTVRTVLPISNSMNEIDVLITNVSIMEQHIVDQMNLLRKSNKDLERLFYVTSVDIKPPLLKAKELTSLAFLRAEDAESKEYLYQINLSWERLLNIADELGIVTNIRIAEIKTERIDLDQLINSVVAELRPRLMAEDIVFSLDIRTKSEFFSSPVLVRAIFRNLIDNGIKYAVKRSSFSFVKISIVDQNDEMLRIEVADNGIGIKKEHQSKIFNMFFRSTTVASGTGLGLYVVQCSLEKLNGAISVESDGSMGSVFTLLLPNNYRRKNIKERILHNREILELAKRSADNV